MPALMTPTAIAAPLAAMNNLAVVSSSNSFAEVWPDVETEVVKPFNLDISALGQIPDEGVSAFKMIAINVKLQKITRPIFGESIERSAELFKDSPYKFVRELGFLSAKEAAYTAYLSRRRRILATKAATTIGQMALLAASEYEDERDQVWLCTEKTRTFFIDDLTHLIIPGAAYYTGFINYLVSKLSGKR